MFEAFVPKPLQYKCDIHKAIVPSHDYLPGGLLCQDSAEEVREIAQTPLSEEVYAQTRCRLIFVVSDDLR